MVQHVLSGLGQAILVVALAHSITFVIIYALTGDTVVERTWYEATDMSIDQVKALRAEYGLDRTLIGQCLSRTRHLLSGNLGRSLVSGRAVGA